MNIENIRDNYSNIIGTISGVLGATLIFIAVWFQFYFLSILGMFLILIPSSLGIWETFDR